MNNLNEISGIYKCKTEDCKNEVVHSKGENFISCGACNNNDWELIRETKIGVLINLSKTQLYLEWIKNMIYLDTISQNAKKRVVKRGSVYKCNLGIGIGSEESKERPCVILQADSGNIKSSNTIVAPITHTTSNLPIVVPIENKFDKNNNKILDGNVLLGNIITVSKARLGDWICDLPKDEMTKIDRSLSISIDIKRHYDKLMNIHEDKLEYIKKLKNKNKDYKNQLDEINSLLGVDNIKDSIHKIKNILSKDMDKQI